MAQVLIVEDDETLLDALAFNLQRDGHGVITAADGVTGLRLAREERPDLLVLDIMLPGMSGLAVCRLVRAETPVPIILLTARDSEQDLVEGLDVGADDYVTKPFSMRELRARVTALLRRDQLSREAGPRNEDAGALQDEVLRAGGLELDIRRHRLVNRGEEVPLRPREFMLLEYLMRHPEQVLSRDRILEAVWGYTYAGETRTVDVHVRWLREKVEADPGRPSHIVTVRGFGYRFDP